MMKFKGDCTCKFHFLHIHVYDYGSRLDRLNELEVNFLLFFNILDGWMDFIQSHPRVICFKMEYTVCRLSADQSQCGLVSRISVQLIQRRECSSNNKVLSARPVRQVTERLRLHPHPGKR